MKRMFFYGLFRADQVLAPDLKSAGGVCLGPRTVPGYTLFSTVDGRGVFARPAEGKEAKGDLWELPTELVEGWVDRCEGHPHNYRRTPAMTTDGEECEIYVMTHAVEAHPGYVMPVGAEWTPETIRAALNRTP